VVNTVCMGNIISNEKFDKKRHLYMTNGGTAVFISVLALAGSYLAQTNWEKAAVTWLASRDQTVLGIGCVCFDIDDLAWSQEPDEFKEQKCFLLRVIARAKSKEDWHLLDYNPPKVVGYLKCFEKMLRRYIIRYVEAKEWGWSSFKPEVIGEKCPKHGVLLHCFGCVVCNDR
jgi:hypothetical protein